MTSNVTRVSGSPFEHASFYLTMPFLVYEVDFLGQLHFWRSYFFTISISLEQLLWHNSYFFWELFLQSGHRFWNSYFFFQNSERYFNRATRYFFRLATSSEQLLFWRKNWVITNKRAFFWRGYFCTASGVSEQLLPLQSYVFEWDTFLKLLFFQSSYFLETAYFSERHYSRTPEQILFQKGYFCRPATFSKELFFRRAPLLQYSFSEVVIFYSYTSIPQLRFPFTS